MQKDITYTESSTFNILLYSLKLILIRENLIPVEQFALQEDDPV
ncbi:Uncharacterised protein [Niallia circulans]|nr:hypothetical protein [Niallia circulans]MED3837278.1 hypothetical protein [Niallia circulans]MED4244349.1 hypothetical protein [Niallia circulans]MED4248918.1 hypothetical protein [Niallia circulans]MED5102783.1 hypothetical protein [Niallia circulans]SPU11501.1 Uncharacterised protein [Niallia circulans]